jgi:hypothetical protein
MVRWLLLLFHLDASMRSWVQIWVAREHEFVHLVVNIYTYVVGGHSWVPTSKPSILSHTDVLTGGTIQMLPCGNIHMVPQV